MRLSAWTDCLQRDMCQFRYYSQLFGLWEYLLRHPAVCPDHAVAAGLVLPVYQTVRGQMRRARRLRRDLPEQLRCSKNVQRHN